MFTSIFKELQSLYGARHEPENMRPLAEVYWRMLLSLALFVIIALFAYGAWEFVGVINNLGSDTVTSTPSASAALDRNALRATLDGIRSRENNLGNPVGVNAPDPSR